MPSRWNDGGMRMSVTSTCGSVARAPATVPSKSAATPTTERSGWRSMSARTPSRTIRLSSARKTSIVAGPSIWSMSLQLSHAGHWRTRWQTPFPKGVLGPPLAVGHHPSPAGGREDHVPMRYESSVTSLSWIPSEAVAGGTRLPFDAGVAHYDAPPPEVLGDLDELRAADRFRFANHLAAWIEVDKTGWIKNAGYLGGGQIGSTTRAPGRPEPRLPGSRPPRHPAQARARRRMGALYPDSRWPHRHASATAGAAGAVRSVAGSPRLDDPQPHPVRGRAQPRDARAVPAASHATGSTTTRAALWLSRVSSTSRTGTASHSENRPHGVTRSRKPW